MNQFDADIFIDNEIKPRWPKWAPTPTIISDWSGNIRAYDYDLLKQAVKQHRAKSTWNDPQWPKITELAALLMPKNKEVHDRDEPTIFVMCVERGFEMDKGHYTCQPGSYRSCTDEHNAQKLRDRHTDLYGGEWEVFSRHTEKQMMAMRKEFSDERKEA